MGIIAKGQGFGVLGSLVTGVVGSAPSGTLLPRLRLRGGDVIGQLTSVISGFVALLVTFAFLESRA